MRVIIAVICLALLGGRVAAESAPRATGAPGPFLTAAELIAQCAAKSAACETYIMAVYDTARAIQENVRSEGKPAVTVLCDASRRPNVSAVVRDMLARAKSDPAALKGDPAVFVLQAINVPFSCK